MIAVMKWMIALCVVGLLRFILDPVLNILGAYAYESMVWTLIMGVWTIFSVLFVVFGGAMAVAIHLSRKRAGVY